MLSSSSSRNLVTEALTWIAVLGIGAAALLNISDLSVLLRSMIGPIPATEVAGGTSDGLRDGASRRSGGVEIPISRDGHYHAEVSINGRTIEAMVDTGASMVALTAEDAARSGVYVNSADYTLRVSTANGVGRAAPVMLERVSIGDITVRNVKAAVIEPGRLHTTLLGMSFLSRLARTEMKAGVLLLED